MIALKSDYQTIARYYDRYREFGPRELAFWLTRFTSLGRIRPGDRVLDLGCGTGRFAIPLALAAGARVTGVDRSPAMIGQAVAKEGSGRVGWVVGDAQALPCAGETFDAALLSLVIHHVEDRPRALAAIHRVLCPGGRLVIWTSSHRQIRQFFVARFFPGVAAVDLARFPSIPVLMAELRGAGFGDVRRQAVFRSESVDKRQFVDKVRNRYISTLSLITDDELAAGLVRLQAHLDSLPGERFTRQYHYTFVTATRPPLGGANLG